MWAKQTAAKILVHSSTRSLFSLEKNASTAQYKRYILLLPVDSIGHILQAQLHLICLHCSWFIGYFVIETEERDNVEQTCRSFLTFRFRSAASTSPNGASPLRWWARLLLSRTLKIEIIQFLLGLLHAILLLWNIEWLAVTSRQRFSFSRKVCCYSLCQARRTGKRLDRSALNSNPISIRGAYENWRFVL